MNKTFLNEILDLNNTAVEKLNSLTKYPSILTYHKLDNYGCPSEAFEEDKKFPETELFITEKIDGTNSRVIFTTDSKGVINDYIIGSRQDLLYAYGDRIINKTLDIVDIVKPIFEGSMALSDAINGVWGEKPLNPDSLYVLYGESYGGNINGAKQYTNVKDTDFRVFDIWEMDKKTVLEYLDMDIAKISIWRDNNNQPYKPVDYIEDFCRIFNLSRVPYRKVTTEKMPETIVDTFNWLKEYEQSYATLTISTATNAKPFNGGKSEGVVVRTADRSFIRKIRFPEYEKYFRMKNKK